MQESELFNPELSAMASFVPVSTTQITTYFATHLMSKKLRVPRGPHDVLTYKSQCVVASGLH